MTVCYAALQRFCEERDGRGSTRVSQEDRCEGRFPNLPRESEGVAEKRAARRSSQKEGETGMRVALYLRVSTDRQETETQALQLREFAARQGWTIVQEYCANS
jgi:hypothetical protein